MAILSEGLAKERTNVLDGMNLSCALKFLQHYAYIIHWKPKASCIVKAVVIIKNRNYHTDDKPGI